MCRVIMVSRADFRAYDKQYGILKLMDHLEKECGGHGNGYALIKGGKIIETRKGQKLTNEEIYGRISVLKWDYLVYHTRINSMGGRGDANCHPFVQDNDCLAMNGTEHSLRTMSDAFGRTDTECIFKNMVGLGLEQTTRALVEFGSVFVGCAGGKPFVVKAGGTLHRWNVGGKSFHASTFPAGVKNVKDLPAGYIWEDGKENLQFIKKSYSGYGYGGYGYGSYGYGTTRSLWEDYGYYGKSSKKSTAKTSSTTPAKSSKPANTATQGTEIKQTATNSGTIVELKPVAKETAPEKKASKKTESWLKAFRLGETSGYEDGYSDGYQEGFDEGREYERNRANGCGDPDDDEYDGTFSDGYYMGYNDALAGVPMDIDVNNVSELAKKKANPSSDYNIGFVDGRDAGYEEGFEAGYTEAEEKLGLKALEQED